MTNTPSDQDALVAAVHRCASQFQHPDEIEPIDIERAIESIGAQSITPELIESCGNANISPVERLLYALVLRQSVCGRGGRTPWRVVSGRAVVQAIYDLRALQLYLSVAKRGLPEGNWSRVYAA